MTVQKDTPHMPLKQQALEVSLGCRATRRLSRIGSHNCNWDSIESDDVIELLVDAAMSQWSVLLKLRGLSRGFRRVVNAKLDALLADLRSKADAARVETQSALDTRTPLGELEALPACSAYAKLLDALFSSSLVEQLIKQRRVAGFWLVRDEAPGQLAQIGRVRVMQAGGDMYITCATILRGKLVIKSRDATWTHPSKSLHYPHTCGTRGGILSSSV